MEPKDWIDLAGALGSIVVAVGTGFLAWATFFLAKLTQTTVADTEKGLKQADRHHQENLRPFCVIQFKDSDTKHPFGKEFMPRPPVSVSTGGSFLGKPYISIQGHLSNKGLGPAKDVVVYLNMGSSVDEGEQKIEGHAFWLTHPIAVCSIIGAGEDFNIDVPIFNQNVASTIVDGQRMPTQILEAVAQDTYEVVLRYRDVFDNSFRTIFARGFVQNLPVELAVAGGNKMLEAQQSARPDKPMPVFLEGEQPWRTLADMQRSRP